MLERANAPQSAEQLEAERTSGHGDYDEPHAMWVCAWWLKLGEFNVGTVTWSTDGQFVRLVNRDNGVQRAWKLTDQYDDHGCRLAVWPD